MTTLAVNIIVLRLTLHLHLSFAGEYFKLYSMCMCKLFLNCVLVLQSDALWEALTYSISVYLIAARGIYYGARVAGALMIFPAWSLHLCM